MDKFRRDRHFRKVFQPKVLNRLAALFLLFVLEKLPGSCCSNEQLKEKLDALQCHFTWQLGVTDHAESTHVLQKLAVEIQHTPHQNQAALLGLQAYLLQLKGRNREALQSLRDAEEHTRQDEQQASAAAAALIIYGNYAWVHYREASYQEAERYLERIQQLYPTPWDVQLIPYIQAQKGWSLLAIRARNGERARECFEVALMLEPGNRYFHAGLGMALYSSWTYFWQPDIAREAIIQLERTALEQPNNYRAKISLAKLLKQVDKERSIGLIEESAENSTDPYVLRTSALFWLKKEHRDTERAMEILRQALQQDPGYHLLYQTLARCYKLQWLHAEEGDNNNILEEAIRHLQQILQNHPDLDLIPVKLQLAEFCGVRDPEEEESIYQELQERIDTLSLKCRQALSLSWGRFFLYKRRSIDQAKAKFMDGYRIPEMTNERKECAQRLRKMAQRYGGDFADAICRFIDETDQNLPVEFAGTNLD